MMTPFSPVSPTPAITDEATLSATLECVLDALPIDMQGNHTPQTLYEVLLWAASHHDTINHTCEVLDGVPSANDIRYHLGKFCDMQRIETQLNKALQSRLPKDIINHRHCLAIDLHLIPYYGTITQENAPYIYLSKAKAGTTYFFAYATIYVIRAHQRVTLAIHAIEKAETMVATITYLLVQLNAVRVKIKRLYLDRGFYSVPVIRWLQALHIPFLMPAIIRGKKGGPVPCVKDAKAGKFLILSRVTNMVQLIVRCRLFAAITKVNELNMASTICCLSAIGSRLHFINYPTIIGFVLGLKPVTESKISVGFAPQQNRQGYGCCL